MYTKLILQIFPLPLASVKIGSLITDPLHPYEDIQNGSTPLSLETDCTKSPTDLRYQLDNGSSKQDIFFSLLNSLSVIWKGSATSSNAIVADNTYAYELTNPIDRFKKLVAQKDVQDWIQEQKEAEQRIYLITGIQTTLNQRIEANTNSSSVASGSLSFDPTSVLKSEDLNDPTNKDSNRLTSKPLNDINTSLKGGVADSRGHESNLSMSTEGERVVAVRIREIFVKEANKATLDPNVKNRAIWKMVGDQRGETAGEQLVEAVLHDEDDDCGGMTEELSVGEGEEKIMYVKLEDLK